MRRLNHAASVFLALALLALPLAGYAEVRTKWSDGSEAITVTSELMTGGEWTYNYSVPRNSEVRSATMRVLGQPYVMDPGTEYQTIHWPYDTSVDFLADGTTDWAFPGTLGLQSNLAANTTEMDLRWEASGLTKNLDIRLPRSTINDFSLTVNNSQSTKFAYRMTVGEREVWTKDSLSFSFNQTSTTKELLNYVTYADINGDPYLDLIGCGANGKVYVSRSINGVFGPATVIDCQVEALQKDMLMIAAGDLDDGPGKDLAVACADGNIYFLLNQGGYGLFGGASRIESGVSSRMASLAITDIDGDGVNDIVGGNLNGRFYVFYNQGGAQFDTSGGPGSDPFKVIFAGTGQMNDVCVEDINLDGFLDLVGANSDRKFYVAPSLGSRDFDLAVPVVTGAYRDINSVDAVDIDKDGDFDLVGASSDGNIRICINLGNAQGFNPGDFDTEPGHIPYLACEIAPNSLKTAVVRDVNGDDWPDIVALGMSNNGQVYLAVNDGQGAYSTNNLYKIFSAGQSSKSVAAAPLVRLGFVDVVVTNGPRMDIWRNNQGPFSETITGPDIVSAIQTAVDGATAAPDVWGNPMVMLRLSISNRYTGQLHFANLFLNYSYNALLDMTPVLSAHMNATAGPDEAPVTVPVLFRMASAGVLRVTELRVDSQIGLVAIIDFPINGGELFKDRTYTLVGRSNYDLDGTVFNYTWTDTGSGRLLGYGSRLQYTPATLGNVTIQLKVRNDVGGKEAVSFVRFNVVEEPAAYLVASRVVANPKNPRQGDTTSLTVTIKNTGKVNATNVGFQVYIDRIRGTPVASGSIDRVDVARTGTTEIFWQPSVSGDHKLIIDVVDCDQKLEKPLLPPTFSISIRTREEINIGPIVAGIIGAFIALGVVVSLVKKRLDVSARRRKQEMEAQSVPGTVTPADLQAASAAQAAQAAQAQDLYAADLSGRSAALYEAASEAASPTKRRFTCPRCGKTTEEEGLLCLECNAKDSIAGARAAIAESGEMALDIEHPQELLKAAEEAFSAGNFADAIENATEAEDEARTTKERFEEASAFATGKKKAIDVEDEARATRPSGPVLGPAMRIGDEPAAPAPRPVVRPAAPKVAQGPVLGPSLKVGEAGRTEAPSAAGGAVTLRPSKCPGCGRDVQPRWKICPNCQTKLV